MSEILVPPHRLTKFEIQNYFQNELKFNGFYSRNNLPKIKDGTNVINLDRFKSIGTHLIDSIMCGYFCIGYIDFMLKGKSLLQCKSLFFSNDYEKNDKIILKYFQ